MVVAVWVTSKIQGLSRFRTVWYSQPRYAKNGKKWAGNLFKKMKCSQACSTQQNPLMPPLTLVISTFDCRILNWKPTAVSLKSFTSNTSSFSRYVARKYMYLPFEECYQVDFVKNNSFKRWFYVTVLVIFTQKYQKYAFLKKTFIL